MLTLKRVDGVPHQEYAVRMERFGALKRQEDESLLAPEDSPEAVNVVTDDGALSRAPGFGDACWTVAGNDAVLHPLPEPVSALFEFQAHNSQQAGYRNFYYASAQGGLFRFIYDLENELIRASRVYGAEAANNEITYFTQFKSGNTNHALIGGPECGPYLYTEDGDLALITGNRPFMRSTALHYGRMFGVGDPQNPQRIWFSAVNNPADFTVSEDAGGYINLTDRIGDTIEAVSFFDTLLVFCRYGIVSVNNPSLQSGFAVENLYYAQSEILPGSICICGQSVLFATQWGVYRFNGSSVVCLTESIRRFFEEEGVLCRRETSVFFHDRYFLSFHTKTGCGILIFDWRTGHWNVHTGADVTGMAVLRDVQTEKLLMTFQGSNTVQEWGAGDHCAAQGEVTALWRSPLNDWGYAHMTKRVREVHFTASGTGDITITVQSEKKEQTRRVSLTATRKVFHLPLDVAGDKLGFSIRNCDGAYFTVSPLTFLYTLQRAGAPEGGSL